MKGNLELAILILSQYIDTLPESVKEKERYEVGELVIYKAFLLKEAGDHAITLQYLDQISHIVVDVDAWLQMKGELLMKLGRFPEARPIFDKLLRRNYECYGYHRLLQVCFTIMERGRFCHGSWVKVTL